MGRIQLDSDATPALLGVCKRYDVQYVPNCVSLHQRPYEQHMASRLLLSLMRQASISIVGANAAVLLSRGAQIALNSMYFFGSANGNEDSSIFNNIM